MPLNAFEQESTTDDAALVTSGQVYDNTQVVSVQLPDTVGPWLDIDGVEYAQNSLQLVVKPAGGVIAASDPITVAEFALLKGGQGRIGDGTLAGPAVERDVIQANRGSTMAFGDLQFRVPSSGNSSLQMLWAGGGAVSITEFTTKWSNQQGGASENAFGFSLGGSWSYFRRNGSLNLTLHNSYQDATFVCLGWLYRVEVIVGSGWTNNRFSFSRWRLDGIKGDAGVDGVDAASIDHISLTAGDSSPGTNDTYTLWADAAEATSLGTYDVPIPAAPAGVETVVLAQRTGTVYVTGDTLTLAGGRTWQDVLDEFKFVYFSTGNNSLFSHDTTVMFDVAELATPNRDLTLIPYLLFGSNPYQWRAITPSAGSTSIVLNNDGSQMQVQRMRIVGVK